MGRSLIIDKSSSQPSWSRGRDWVLSGLMWLLYLYLIREALVDAADLVTGALRWEFGGGERPVLPRLSAVLVTLRQYGLVALINGAVLIAWARYNQNRFRGRERRGAHKLVTTADMAELYRVPEADVAIWRQARILVMRHEPDGTLGGVTTHGVHAQLGKPLSNHRASWTSSWPNPTARTVPR